MNRLYAMAVTLLALSPTLGWAQSNDVIWRGDWASGDLSQWPVKQMVSPDRIQVVTPPTPHDGFQHAIKVTVKQGDNPINASGNRNELVSPDKQLPEGTEVWYRWSTMFAANYPIESAWQVFSQWHQPSDSGSPPIEFTIYGSQIQLSLNASTWVVWTAPLVRGVWHDFMLHVKFSDNAKVGFVELWYEGQPVLKKTYVKTFANARQKLGLYRNSSIRADGVVYHMGMVMGRTMASVQPKSGGTTPPTTGDRLWTGDFSSGDTSQWTSVQSAAADRLQIVPQATPLHESNRFQAKVTVRPGDTASGGNRSQLVRTKVEPEGSDTYYRWSTLFPSDYPSTASAQTFFSFNHGDTVPAPVQLRTVGEELQLIFGDGRVLWHAPLVRGRWLRFIVHANFSDDPSKGFVELWYDGDVAMAKAYGATLANDFLKLGLNRGPGITVPSTVYFDGMVQGRTLASVLPGYVPAAATLADATP